MGVRGLTTFIAKNSDKYLEHYELHDTYLVIDGNNLAAQLYKWYAKCYDCFGGDYNEYAKTIIKFFEMLKECNITPLIVFDGSYENRKLRTIYSRIKNRIKDTKHLNCANEGRISVFPLFLRELFIEVIVKLNLKTVRSVVEADDQIACIARTLNCPILSYDSDFYIFDVLYIPFTTMDMKSTKINGVRFIECRLYKMEKFLKSFGGLQKENVPLLGTLLGNDYIKANVFNKFYEHLKLAKRKNSETDQQRRIAAVIKWLQDETYESAVKKILGRVKIENRKYIAEQMQLIADGYKCEESELMKYLNLNTKEVVLKNVNSSELNRDIDKESIIQPEIPNFFLENYKKCIYPACFMDIYYHSTYFFVPQIENYNNIASHNISLNILSAIYKILSTNESKPLRYIIRNKRANIQTFYLEKSTKDLPTLIDLKTLTGNKASDYLHCVLETNIDICNRIALFPNSWKLYMFSVIYWIQNVQPKVTKNHIYSILLSAIILKTRQWIQIYTRCNISDALMKITKNEMKELSTKIKHYFQMDIKLRKNPKLFDVTIVDSFAQFQSCAFHIKYLNTLLNNPLENYLISDFYNGTLIYNLYSDFANRNDVDAYLHLFLDCCPNVLHALDLMKSTLTSNLMDVAAVVQTRRKRNRRKKNGNVEKYCYSSSNEKLDNVYDVNNKFSLLGIS